jgi:hypothetical protein
MILSGAFAFFAAIAGGFVLFSGFFDHHSRRMKPSISDRRYRETREQISIGKIFSSTLPRRHDGEKRSDIARRRLTPATTHHQR